jgi:hypothetical protein
MIDELYKQYGELMVKQEILQGQINEVKRKIAEELNKSKPEVPIGK